MITVHNLTKTYGQNTVLNIDELEIPKGQSFGLVGNIGAGKTTIFTKLQSENTDPNILFVHEPVNQWLSYRDPATKETLLSAYYKHPQQYAFPFQITALLTRLTLLKNTIEQNPHAKLIITERSLQSDFEIFAKMLYNDQKINIIMFYFSRTFELKDEFHIRKMFPSMILKVLAIKTTEKTIFQNLMLSCFVLSYMK